MNSELVGLDFISLIAYTDFGRNPIASSIRSRSGIDPADAAGSAALTVETGSTKLVLLFCLEIRHFRGFQLKLKLVSYKRDEFRVGGFSLGIAHRVAEESLEGIQIAPVPGHFDGVPDCSLNTAGRGLECFRHLGVEYFGDSIRVPGGPRRGFRRKIIYCIIHEPRHLLSIGLLK